MKQFMTPGPLLRFKNPDLEKEYIYGLSCERLDRDFIILTLTFAQSLIGLHKAFNGGSVTGCLVGYFAIIMATFGTSVFVLKRRSEVYTRNRVPILFAGRMMRIAASCLVLTGGENGVFQFMGAADGTKHSNVGTMMHAMTLFRMSVLLLAQTLFGCQLPVLHSTVSAAAAFLVASVSSWKHCEVECAVPLLASQHEYFASKLSSFMAPLLPIIPSANFLSLPVSCCWLTTNYLTLLFGCFLPLTVLYAQEEVDRLDFLAIGDLGTPLINTSLFNNFFTFAVSVIVGAPAIFHALTIVAQVL